MAVAIQACHGRTAAGSGGHVRVEPPVRVGVAGFEVAALEVVATSGKGVAPEAGDGGERSDVLGRLQQPPGLGRVLSWHANHK